MSKHDNFSLVIPLSQYLKVLERGKKTKHYEFIRDSLIYSFWLASSGTKKKNKRAIKAFNEAEALLKR